MAVVLISDSYSAEPENKLVKNTEISAGMKNQDDNEGKRTWTIVRSYKSQFSCIEAVERLIKIHMDTKEDMSCQKVK